MIIGRAVKTDGAQVLLLGLSAENLRRLQAMEPMYLRRKTHGDGIPENWEVVIFYGETEAAMEKELIALRAIGPETKIHIDPRL